jgi:hypothetical protein
MRTGIKRAIAAASIAVAGTAGVAGATAASASTAARSGTEHFQLMSTSFTSNKASVILTGVFTAGGVDIQGKNDRIVLPGGGFTIIHKAAHSAQHFSPRTCLGVDNETGTYKIVKGTGRYAGISGHGSYRLSVMFVGSKNAAGKCSQSKPPQASQVLIRASGPVSGVK